jgi:HAD superfamily hydrolase (TIGR01459 family)
MMHSPPVFTDRFRTIAPAYDVVLSDVWGVIHNGVAAFVDACEALARFRAAGGTVILITNAPRTNDVVIDHLDSLKVPRDSYDAVATSGDVTRGVIAARRSDAVFHIGPERDLSLFRELDVPVGDAETAAYVVCSGLYDDTTETPEDYRELLARIRARDLFMVCANPDLVVERGTRRFYCAGSIADLYASLGGEVLYAGKPHRPIYQEAVARAAAIRGVDPGRERVLAIGDSVRTDLTGATRFGIDCLFVTAGIHGEELGERDAPDPAMLAELFATAAMSPRVVTRRLAW